jgi:heme/copper-type cytochrome/quinol oxidase subunit 2
MRLLLLLPLLLAVTTVASAADAPSFSITIQNRAFQPPELTVPAGQKIELQIKNTDAAPAEFESDSLHREKVVPAGQQVVVYIGPLRAGSYEFFNDFYPQSRGHIIAK